MNIGRIVSRAWHVTWRHKVLWIFGIVLALCGAGASGMPRFQYTFNQSDLDLFRHRLPNPPWFYRGPGTLGDPNLWNWGTLAGGAIVIGLIVLVVMLVITIVSAMVRYTSTGALVQMVDEIEETDETTFKAGVGAGWKNLLKLFAIDFLLGLVGLFFALVLGVVAALGIVLAIGPALALSSAGALRVLAVIWAVVAGLGILAVLIVLSLAINAPIAIIREFAYRFTVLDGANVFDAIGRASRLLRSRPRSSLLVWLVLVGFSLALGLLLVPPTMMIMMAAVAGVWGLLRIVTSQALLGLIVAAPIMLLVILLVGLVSGIFVVFGSTIWTLAYRELTEVPAQPA